MITVTLTEEQYELMLKAFEEQKKADMSIACWTQETPEVIEARYQIPHDDILADMADYVAQQMTGVPMF